LLWLKRPEQHAAAFCEVTLMVQRSYRSVRCQPNCVKASLF